MKRLFGAVLLTSALAGGVAALLPSRSLADDSASEWKAPARAAKKKNPFPADATSLATGKQLYLDQCLSCHGPAGKGDGTAAKDLDPKPKDLSDPALQGQTDGALYWKITEGKKPMPSFATSLSDEQRWHTVNYIRTLAPTPTK